MLLESLVLFLSGWLLTHQCPPIPVWGPVSLLCVILALGTHNLLQVDSNPVHTDQAGQDAKGLTVGSRHCFCPSKSLLPECPSPSSGAKHPNLYLLGVLLASGAFRVGRLQRAVPCDQLPQLPIHSFWPGFSSHCLSAPGCIGACHYINNCHYCASLGEAHTGR